MDLIGIYQIAGAENDGDKIRAISPIFQKIRFFGFLPLKIPAQKKYAGGYFFPTKFKFFLSRLTFDGHFKF